MNLPTPGRVLRRVARSARLPRLVFVLGSQRSGTNALRQSLSLDPWVRGFNEHRSNRLYDDWKLRPEPEIRWFLRRQPGTVLLKPIRSVIDRPVGEFLAEFAAYEYRVAWIYRDPVRVYVSRRTRWPHLTDIADFVAEWNRVNGSALEARDERFAIVSHGDLIADRTVFGRLCRFLDIRGEYLFRPDTGRAHEELSDDEIDRITAGTAEVREGLDQARTFTPEPDG